MPLIDLRDPNGLHRGVLQSNEYRCGAACAVYVLAMLGKYNTGNPALAPLGTHYRHDQPQNDAMARTHSAGRAEAWGSTPRKIAEYVRAQKPGGVNLHVSRVPEGALSTMEKARARLRRTTHPWLATCRTQLTSYAVGSGAYGPGDAILRNVIPRRASMSTHFVVQTFFAGGIQIMDPSTGNISSHVGPGGHDAYLAAMGEPAESTLIDVVFSSY